MRSLCMAPVLKGGGRGAVRAELRSALEGAGAGVRCEPSCARLGRARAPVPPLDIARYRESLWTDGDQVGEAERWVCASLVVAHVGVVVVVDVGIRHPLEIASTDCVDDVHGAGGAGLRRIVIRILIAGGDIDLAAVGGGGGGERVG